METTTDCNCNGKVVLYGKRDLADGLTSGIPDIFC